MNSLTFGVAFTGLTISALLTTGSPARASWTVGAYLYEHSNYQGQVRPILAGESINITSNNWNDKVSSIQVAPNCTLRAYLDANFIPNPPLVFPAGDYSYVGNAYNDRISSVAVICTSYTASSNFWKLGALVYADANYQGDLLPLSVEDYFFPNQPLNFKRFFPSLTPNGWNDRISSIKVAPQCTLSAYQDINYAPFPPIVYTANTSNVGSAYNDKFSSMYVSCTE
jgi:hypothetical protein